MLSLIHLRQIYSDKDQDQSKSIEDNSVLSLIHLSLIYSDNACVLINKALSKQPEVSHFIPNHLKKPWLTESSVCVQSIPTLAKVISVISRADVPFDLLARMLVALAPLVISHLIDKWQCS